ncbi:RHS repeat-associated core domain-containing protein [Kribbella yunnanensis]|uniref:RHS repeat-associated core domain-containing protein n=1 Tax=Kribbella yunnanensis TaxID=190194 RepID=UPI0031DF9F8F
MTKCPTCTEYTLIDGDSAEYDISSAGLSKIRDQNGRLTTIGRDTSGRLATLTDAVSGRGLKFTWTTNHIISAEPTPTSPGESEKWTYNYTGDLLTSVCDPRGAGGCTTYSSAQSTFPSKITSVKSPMGRVTFDAIYAATGSIQSIRANAATTQRWNYAWQDVAGGKTATVTNPRGAITKYGLDTYGRTTKVTDPAGGVQTWEFDPQGQMRRYINAVGSLLELEYRNGNIITRKSWRDGSNYTTQSFYYYEGTDKRAGKLKDVGDPRRPANPDASILSFTYDDSGRLTERVGGAIGVDHPTQKYSYTTGIEAAFGGIGKMPAGLLKATTVENGASSTIDYDSQGSVRQTTDAAGLRTTYDYSPLGKLISRTEYSAEYPAGVKYSMTYDALGRLQSILEPAIVDATSGLTRQLKHSRVYNLDGNLTAEITVDLNSSATERRSFEVDAAGQTIAVRGNDGELQEQSTYDAVGNLIGKSDSAGTQTVFEYTQQDQLALVKLVGHVDSDAPATPRDIVVATNSYDPAGRLTRTKDSAGQVREHRYTPDGLLLRVTALDAPAAGGRTENIIAASYVYDSAGNLVRQELANGQVVRAYSFDDGMNLTRTDLGGPGESGTARYFKYNKFGQLTEVSDGYRPLSIYSYDQAGRTIRSESWGIDANYRSELQSVSRNRWDSKGLLRASIDPRSTSTDDSSKATLYDYDAVGRPISVSSPVVSTVTDGQTTSGRLVSRKGYDSLGRLAVEVGTDNATRKRSYDQRGRLISLALPSGTTPAGPVVPTYRYAYDTADRLVRVTSPDGVSRTTSYDDLGRAVASSAPSLQPDGATRTWTTSYDDTGRITRQTDPVGGVTEFEYDTLNRNTAASRIAGTVRHQYQFEYDAAGNRIAEITPKGNRTTYTFRADGQIASSKDADGIETHYYYDNRGYLNTRVNGTGLDEARMTNAMGQTVATLWRTRPDELYTKLTEMHYDLAGNEIERIDPLGNTTKRNYDNLSRVSRTVAPNGDTEEWKYDAGGKIASFRDGRGHETTASHNSWGLLESRTEPATASHQAKGDRTWSYQYDQMGRAVKSTEPGGISSELEFDIDGNAVKRTAAGPSVSAASSAMNFDAAGRPTSFSHPAGTQTLTYDGFGQLVNSAGPAGDANLTYDADGMLTSRTDAAGTTTTEWTAAGRIAKMTPPAAPASTYSYDAAGMPSAQSWSDGVARSFVYDPRGRLVSDELTRSGGASLAKRTYAYDAADQRVSVVVAPAATAGGGQTIYEYDSSHRLAGWTGPDSTKHTLSWDAANNLVRQDGHNRTYDERNRLTQDGGTLYEYLPNGARSAVVDGVNRIETHYDGFGRTVDDGGDSYTYDGLDRLATAGSTTFKYAGTEPDAVGFGASKFSRDPAGDLVSNQDVRLVTDMHGDNVVGIKPDKSIASQAFDPFGKPLPEFGLALQPFGFQSDWTAEKGTVNMHARWYDPATATFTTRDAATVNVDEMNRYTYGAGNPINASDPSGNYCASVYTAPICLGAAIGGTVTAPTGPGAIGGAVIGGAIGAAVGAGIAICAWKCGSSGASPASIDTSFLPDVSATQHDAALAGELASLDQQLAMLDRVNTAVGAAPGGVSQALAGVSGMSAGLSQANASVNGALAGLSQANAGVSGALAGLSQANAGINGALSGISQMNAGIGGALAGLSQANAGINGALSGISQMNAGIGGMSTGISQINAGISGMSTGISQINAGISGMSTGISQINAGISGMLAGISQMNAGIGGMSSGVSKMLGGIALLNLAFDTFASVSVTYDKFDPGFIRLGPMSLPPKTPAGILDAAIVCETGRAAICQAATTRAGPACAAIAADLTTACMPNAPQPDTTLTEPQLSTGGGGRFVDPPPQVGADDPCDPANGPPPTIQFGNGRNYSVAFQMELSASSYPGTDRPYHFQEGNRALYDAMESDPRYEALLECMTPGIKSQLKGPRGGWSSASPKSWTWHHHQEPGIMQLVPRIQHGGKGIWKVFHPGGVGGFKIWG